MAHAEGKFKKDVIKTEAGDREIKSGTSAAHSPP